MALDGETELAVAVAAREGADDALRRMAAFLRHLNPELPEQVMSLLNNDHDHPHYPNPNHADAPRPQPKETRDEESTKRYDFPLYQAGLASATR